MTVYRITPDLVYVRTAKTAGTTIFDGVFRKSYLAKADDYFPVSWRGAYSFGVVRNPLDRFCSAYRQFRDGPMRFVGSPVDFFDHVRDDRTPISSVEPSRDDPYYTAKAIRYHASRQFEPVSCLDYCDDLIHFEALDEQLPLVTSPRWHQMPERIPHLNRTFGETWEELLTVKLARQLCDFYREDFERGGYATI